MDRAFRGVFCMIPTVFDYKGELDVEGFKENIWHLEKAGMHGIVAMASVGQYFLINDDEFKKVASAAREACDKMACVIGTHWQNTRECVARTKYAEDIGADGAFILPPYYSNLLDSESCYAHYKAVHDATSKIQIMAYNFEASGFPWDITLWDRLLRDFPRLTAVKECTPLIEVGELVRKYGQRISVMAGAETSLYPYMLMGGAGSVSVHGTAFPKFMLRLYDACVEKKWDEALGYHQLLNSYWYEWRTGEYHAPDNKASATAAGRKGGFQRPPFESTNEGELNFHRKWLKKLDEAVSQRDRKI